MPLNEEEKTYVVDKVVEIMRAPDRQKRIEELRLYCMSRQGDDVSLDDAAYSVLQAIEELYGDK